MLEDDAQLGLGDRQPLARADEERDACPAPVLDLEPEGRVRLRRRVRRDAVDGEVPVVLATHVVGRVGLDHGLEEGDLGVLDRLGLAAGRRIHRTGGDDLHQMVDDDVAQRADRVVEVAAILDAEVLRHRDLHRGDVVPAPQRLEHRVREAEVDDLLEPQLSEVVVDAIELRLVDRLVQLRGERARRLAVVTERLLHHHAGVLRQPRVRESLDHPAEEERRDLQVEDGLLGVRDRLCDALVRRRFGEVARHVGEAGGQPLEDVLVERLSRSDDRLPCALDELVDTPVVDRHAHDRAVEQAAPLQPVQRPERHHLRQVSRDPEDDEDIGRLLSAGAHTALPPEGRCLGGRRACSTPDLERRLLKPGPTSSDPCPRRNMDPSRKLGVSSLSPRRYVNLGIAMGSDRTDGSPRPRVVILGGGFAGVGAARKLKDADVDVVVVDKHDYHTFQPLLYQVATDLLERTRRRTSAARSLPRPAERRRARGDSHRRRSREEARWSFGEMAPLTYDYLVVALGAQVNFFGTPGAAEHAFPMYTLADAVRLKEHVLERWQAADRDPGRDRRRCPQRRRRRRRPDRCRDRRRDGRALSQRLLARTIPRFRRSRRA